MIVPTPVAILKKLFSLGLTNSVFIHFTSFSTHFLSSCMPSLSPQVSDLVSLFEIVLTKAVISMKNCNDDVHLSTYNLPISIQFKCSFEMNFHRVVWTRTCVSAAKFKARSNDFKSSSSIILHFLLVFFFTGTGSLFEVFVVTRFHYSLQFK